MVKMLPYFFKELRIVIGDDTLATSLVMNTNQDTTLKVQGLRSDSMVWVDIEAKWEIKEELGVNPPPPGWIPPPTGSRPAFAASA